jgi:hypothetical protein
LRPALFRRTEYCSGRKLMKPIDELNRTTVLVLYWVLFAGVGNCGVEKAGARSLGDGLEQCRTAGKCEDAVRGSVQVVSRSGAGGMVAEWAHTSSAPCPAGSAGGLVTAAGKVMSYPSGGHRRGGRAAAVRYEPSFQSRTRDKGAGSCRSGPHRSPGNPYLAKAKALAVGLSNAYFKSLGLPSLFEDC